MLISIFSIACFTQCLSLQMLSKSSRYIQARTTYYERNCNCYFNGFSQLQRQQEQQIKQKISTLPTTTSLGLDIFGLGPTEVLVIVGAAVLLYGPSSIAERFKNPLKARNKKQEIDPAKIGSDLSGWEKDRLIEINEMKAVAQKFRKQRAMSRIEAAMEEEENN